MLMRSAVIVLSMFVVTSHAWAKPHARTRSRARTEVAPPPPPPAPAPQAGYQPQPQPQQGFQPQPQPQQGFQPQPGYPQQQPQQPTGYQPYPQQPGAYQPAPSDDPNAGDPAPSAAPTHDSAVSSVDGLIQVGLGTSIVQYNTRTWTDDISAVKTSFGTTSWGFAENPVTLEGGYGLSEQMVLGGVLQLGGRALSTQVAPAAAASSSSFAFLLGPKFDYMFLPDSKLNPFVGATLAVGLTSDGSDASKLSTTTFNFSARGGVRYFFIDGLSIDPALTLGGAIGSGSQKTSALTTSYSVSGFQFGLTVGLSLWLK